MSRGRRDGAPEPVDDGPVLPPPATRNLHMVTIASGGLTLAVGTVAAAGGALVPVAVVAASGLLNVASGAYALRAARGLQLLAAAANQAELGRVDVARRMLDLAVERGDTAPVRRGAHVLRSAFALREGDHAGAIAEADRALALRPARWERGTTWLPRLSAAGIRALSRAATGDAEGARADVASVRALARSTSSANQTLGSGRAVEEALARASLAEALLLGKDGAHEALQAHLQRQHLQDAPDGLVGAQACLALARRANERGEFEQAGAHADKGLARIQNWLLRGITAEDVLPSLAVERAFARAATGDDAAALAELDTLPEAFPYRARSEFAVRLVAAAKVGDLASARALVAARPSGLPASATVEALAALVRATSEPLARTPPASSSSPWSSGGVGAASEPLVGLDLQERKRLAEELERVPDRRAWLEKLVPALLARFEAGGELAPSITRARLRVPAVEAGSGVESEARGEEELLADAEGATRASRRLL